MSLIFLYILSLRLFFFFFSSRRRHTRCLSDWSSDVCSSDLLASSRVHCLQIAVRTLEEAKSVLDQLRAGAAFDKVARQVGISPDARNGGDLEIGRASCRERG